MKTSYTENLFFYGTLQLESVQIASFGRKLDGKHDVLLGYKLSKLRIIDPDVVKKSGKKFHPIAISTGNKTDEVEGMFFKISKEELENADKYEVSDYKRVSVKLKSGPKTWVYVKA